MPLWVDPLAVAALAHIAGGVAAAADRRPKALAISPCAFGLSPIWDMITPSDCKYKTQT